VSETGNKLGTVSSEIGSSGSSSGAMDRSYFEKAGARSKLPAPISLFAFVAFI
jgi:hypothetical protein